MKKYLLPLIFLVQGCASSSLVERVHSPYKGGTVKYLNQGATFVINGRIRDAEKKMEDYCGGDYEILRDGTTNELSGGVAFKTGYVAPLTSEYVYIQFKCAAEKSASN